MLLSALIVIILLFCRANKERRREKSKIAARNRRGKETEVFEDLAELIPIPDSVKESLDKASIVRLACCTIKLNKLRDHWNNANIGSEIEETQNVCQALGGFLVIIGADGDIILTSESITTSLGLAHVSKFYSSPAAALLSVNQTHFLISATISVRGDGEEYL
jgi:hypothetical protein